jgi:hypothetical protein
VKIVCCWNVSSVVFAKAVASFGAAPGNVFGGLPSRAGLLGVVGHWPEKGTS